MVKLQKTMKGVYFIEIPAEIVRLAGWQEGAEVEIRVGGDVQPRRKDLVLRLK